MEDFNGRDDEFSTHAATGGADWLRQFTDCLKARRETAAQFATKNEIVRVSATMRLRRFGRATSATKTLVVAPLVVHDASFVDLMAGHSLVQVLRDATRGAVYLTDWTSVAWDMRHAGVDAYLSDLNVALDDIGAPVNLVGLSQGGLLAALLAARFPHKIAKLVLAGAPLDLSAAESEATRAARTLSLARHPWPEDDVIDGAQWLGAFGVRGAQERGIMEALQRDPGAFGRGDLEALRLFDHWSRRSLDLPGRYAREMLSQIIARNQLARGEYVALGRRIDLKAIRAPLFVLAAAQDQIAPKEQALAAISLIGAPRARIRHRVAPCGHFALFAGARTLAREWRTIGHWLGSDAPLRRKPQRIEGSAASSAP